jgi:hypothetical protein
VAYLKRLLLRAGLMARLTGPREVLRGLERLVRMEQALLAGGGGGVGVEGQQAGGGGGAGVAPAGLPSWLWLGGPGFDSGAGAAAGAVADRLLVAAVG